MDKQFSDWWYSGDTERVRKELGVPVLRDHDRDAPPIPEFIPDDSDVAQLAAEIGRKSPKRLRKKLRKRNRKPKQRKNRLRS